MTGLMLSPQWAPALVRLPSPRGWGQGTPGFWLGPVGILWYTGVAQASADAGLAQEWPREPDVSAKEAQVGQPGGVTPEGEMVLLRGRVGTGKVQCLSDARRPVSCRRLPPSPASGIRR